MFFTSESVSEGHPDKVADQISDAILDELLLFDSKARVACETLCKTGLIIIAGEISYNHDTVHKNEIKLGRKMKRYSDIAREVVKEIGYNDSSTGFDHKSCGVLVALEEQSPDIAQGVDSSDGKEQGAGDQGMMFGYATTETPEYMPASLQYAHALLKNLSLARKSGEVDWLRPDAKSQITVEYENGQLKRVDTVVLSTMHAESVSQAEIRNFVVETIIPRSIPHHLIDSATKYFINPTGKFVIGGPQGDCGLTGRKIIVDTYGGHGAHGGGAFCIASNARVNTELGMKKIADCSEVSGKLVKTDVHPMPSGAWYDNGTKETIFLTTTDGYSLEATPEHNIRVINADGNYVWKELQHVDNQDYIPIQTKNRLFGNGYVGNFAYIYKEGTAEGRKKRYTHPEYLTDDYAYLLGLLIGDGDCTDEECIKICVCEEAQKVNVENLFLNLFGDKGKTYGHWAYIGGVELRAYLSFLGLSQSKSFDKTVPESVWTGTKTNVASFLKGLFDTDGCVRIAGRNKTSPRIHLATTSKKLAEDVQLLLLNFGIISKIGKSNNVGKVTAIGKRKVVSKRILYNVTLKGLNSVKIFKEEIGFGLHRKQTLLNETHFEKKKDLQIIPNQRQRIVALFKRLPIEEQKTDKINIGRFTRKSQGKATKEITYQKLGQFLETYENYLKLEPEFNYLKELYLMKHYYTQIHHKLPSFAHTYDLNIPETHTFTANGFVVHNSGKDPSKVDRSAAYMGRYIAKNIVAAKLADKVLVQIAYAIGVAKPVSVNIQTFGTEKVSPEVIEKAVLTCFDMTPAGIVKVLNLLYPTQCGFTYMSTASYGHFGRDLFPWEKIDKVQALHKAVGAIMHSKGDLPAWQNQENREHFSSP